MSGPIAIRHCHTLEEFHACVALQREIWEEEPLEVEPATMFIVAVHTGGQVLGAFDGESNAHYTNSLTGRGGAKLEQPSKLNRQERA